jgi:hypothetical protein
MAQSTTRRYPPDPATRLMPLQVDDSTGQLRPNYDRTVIVASASIRTIGLYLLHHLHEKCLSGGIWGEPSGT